MISPTQIERHWNEFPAMWFPPAECARRLFWVRTEQRADPYYFDLAKRSPRFAGWTDHELLTFVPRTCHENAFYCTVGNNG